jgi:hypothetical protein
MKRNSKTPTRYSLEVLTYSVRIHPGQSSNPPSSVAGKSMGYVILEGTGTPFLIQFLPDGSNLQQTSYNAGLKAVEMSMNWCQLNGLMHLLESANSVQACYDESDGFADVEGQFVRPKGQLRRK